MEIKKLKYKKRRAQLLGGEKEEMRRNENACQNSHRHQEGNKPAFLHFHLQSPPLFVVGLFFSQRQLL